MGERKKFKFDVIIGNPPYQEEFSKEGNKTFAAPIYNDFIDSAIKISDKFELIHPGRFLFDAGSTPKAWNKKMLNDPHLKVLYYQENSTKVFPNTDIKGGVVVTYYDAKKDFGAIRVFTKYDKLNSLLHRILTTFKFQSMDSIVVSRTAYRLTEKMHEDYPEVMHQLSKGHAYDMATNIFEKAPQIFLKKKPNDGKTYVQILGRENNERVYKFIRSDYINSPVNLSKFKVFMSSGNGAGHFGEILTSPIVADKSVGSTETFISIGAFDTKEEAVNLGKYIKTKFVRTMIGVLKTTQHLTPSVWKYVPLQDFTPHSDIDWSQSIADIDKQLYKKYGLSQEEIDFIESHVREMV